MINSVTLIGRTTREIDLRYTPSGAAVANFNIAVNRQFKSANGERETDFINVVQFGKGAELTAQYVKKGNQIGLTGRIQTRNYENSEGKRIYVTEVVAENVQFLESKGSGQPNNQQQQINAANKEVGVQSGDQFKGQGNPIDVSDSDLPF